MPFVRLLSYLSILSHLRLTYTDTVTCMDARIDPASAYGISLGDAHVIRNAGASAKDALRSLVISEQLLGTEEILVIKHTGCGMLTFKNEDATVIVKQNLGDEAVAELGAFKGDFIPFPQLEEAVKEDVEFLKGSKLIPEKVAITGWVYEVETGKVRSVV
jgi:carbonic anhydrase